jgi:hypothetical protein
VNRDLPPRRHVGPRRPPSALPVDPDGATSPLLTPPPPPPDDPWSYAGGPLSQPEPVRRRGPAAGPSGCVLGGVAALLIGLVAAMVAWPLVVRPLLSEAARDRIRDAVQVEVDRIVPPTVVPTGDLVVTEARMNAYLAAHADAFGPIDDPEVDVSPGGVWVGFSLYGTDSALTGRPVARDGRVVIEDGEVHGAAGQLITAEEAAALVEGQVARVLAAAGVRATGVELADGRLTIATAPIR